MDLQELREQIDEIDGQLVALFMRRLDVAAAIARHKAEHGLPILDAGREETKLAAIAAMAGEEGGESLRSLYETIFAVSRVWQERISVSRKPS